MHIQDLGLNSTTGERSIDYLEMRWWVGVWTGLFCIAIVVTDASACVKYITRYTEESFATLISVIFIVDGFKKLMKSKWGLDLKDSELVNEFIYIKFFTEDSQAC